MKKRLAFWLVTVIITLCMAACSSTTSLTRPMPTSGLLLQESPESNLTTTTAVNAPAITPSTVPITQNPAPITATNIPNITEKNAVLDINLLGLPVLIAGNFKFTEGPAWDKRRNILLFSDIDANRIYQLSLPNTISVFREPSNKSNGLTFDTEGHILAAEHGSRSVTITLGDGTIKTIADNYLGKQLNSPNDLAVRADGTIYFTDPVYGLDNRPTGVDFTGLYRLSPVGDILLEGKFDRSPNGVALSPDQETLYLALTTGNQVLAFDVAKDGVTSNGRTFAILQQPDGIAVDIAGNVYVAGIDGIYVFSFGGKQLGKIKTDSQPTNCEFGGPSGNILFITARESLYRLDVPIPGFEVK